MKNIFPSQVHPCYISTKGIYNLGRRRKKGRRKGREGADGVLIAGVPFRVTLKSVKRATRVRFEITSIISDHNHN